MTDAGQVRAGAFGGATQERSQSNKLKALRSFASELQEQRLPFVKLMEMGVADRDPDRAAVCFLVGLAQKPGERLALSNIEWVQGKGVDVDSIRAACGFSIDAALPPTSFPFPTVPSRPPLSEENRRQGQELHDKAHSAPLGSRAQRDLYIKALDRDPNLRLSWAELSLVAAANGDYQVADKCKEAIRVFDAGRFLKDYRDILG